MSSLAGQTAIITGASKGIGKGIAAEFVDAGANVVVNSRSQERADEAAAAITEDGGNAIGVAADVTEYDAVQGLVEAAVDAYGSLDIMINNAGMTVITPAEEFDPADWRQVIDVDLTGVFFGSQLAAEQMIAQGTGGSILNVSSMMGEMGLKMRSAYCAAKGGVNNLTRTLAVEWAPHDITVNALAPGYIRTDITEQTQQSAGYTERDIQTRTPMERFGTVEEMASCAAFLVAQDNFVTGEVLTADGGWTADAWRYWEDRAQSD